MNKPVYALSGYAEWFWLMAKNWKDVENRDWSLNRRFKPQDLPVRIYLHASKTKASTDECEFIFSKLTDQQWDAFLAVDWDSLRGKIIGEITITAEVMDLDSVWFCGEYGFTVKDGILYKKPIPCRGMLGFFKPSIPSEVKA